MTIDDRIAEVLERDGAYIAAEHRRAIYRAGAEDMRERCAKICEERQHNIGCSHAFDAAKRIRALETP